MNVKIYSRETAEHIIAEGKFPENTAVISFHDPALKHLDKDYSAVDYSSVCENVFYCEADDLDLDYLPEKGYTYETFFPQANELAEFIVKAYMVGRNIICQCEYGQSRSAGCAAAILEYFSRNGIAVFADYSYYPNQVIFHKVYDALVRVNPIYSNSMYSQDKPDKYLDFTTGASSLYSARQIEKKLTEQGNCCHSLEEAYYKLCHGLAKVYVSAHISDAKVCHGNRMGEHNVGVKTFFKHNDKEVPLIIYIPRLMTYSKPHKRDYYSGRIQSSAGLLSKFSSVSLDVLGIMKLDCKEPVIEEALINNISGIHRHR